MAFNGAGVFNRLYSWVQDAINGIKIRADRMDAEDNGFATGLTDCVTRDGQSPWLANLPAGGFKISNLAAGTANGDSVSYGQNLGTGIVDTLSINGGVVTSSSKLSIVGGIRASGLLCDNNSGISWGGGGTVMTGISSAFLNCVTNANGVSLTTNATSWSALSSREYKKNFEPIVDAISTIKNLNAEIGHYNTDEDDAPKRPFLYYEDAVKWWPHAAHYTPAQEIEVILEDEAGEKRVEIRQVPEMKTLSLEQFVPLLIKANQELVERLETLERKINV